MQIALISDIHGNLFALDTVLHDIAQRQIKHILCLGDVASGGPQPREVIQRLRDVNCPIIMGNNDDWLLHPRLKPRSTTFDQNNQDIDYWSAQQLSKDDQAFIRSFVSTFEWQINATSMLLGYHGSPRSFSEKILPMTPDETLNQAYAQTSAQLLAGGHTHIQMFRRYRTGLIINPGSIGMALDRTAPSEDIHKAPWSEYAILTIGEDKLHTISIEFCRIPFDLKAFLDIVLQVQMPHATWVASRWTKASSDML
jgi:putative phosphoesterase